MEAGEELVTGEGGEREGRGGRGGKAERTKGRQLRKGGEGRSGGTTKRGKKDRGETRKEQKASSLDNILSINKGMLAYSIISMMISINKGAAWA